MENAEKVYKYCPTCKTELSKKIVDDQRVPTCSWCGFIFWNNPKPVVSFLFVQNGKVFMLQRAREPLTDYWCLPGGFMRYEETPEESIKREMKEETGLHVTIEGLVGVYRIDNDPRGVHIDMIYYGKGDGKITLSSEDKTYSYYRKDELPELIAYKHRDAIRDWFKREM